MKQEMMGAVASARPYAKLHLAPNR